MARAPARRNLAQAALGFVQFADVLEHFACGGRRFVVRGLVLGVADQAAQVLAILLGLVCRARGNLAHILRVY